MRRILPVLLILACLVPLAGCGGSDTKRNNDYVRKLNAAQTSFAAAATRISSTVTTGSSSGQDRKTLLRYQDAISQVITRLLRIDVPSTVRPDHQRLVAAMTSFGRDIRSATHALNVGTPSSLDRAKDTLRRALPRLNRRIRLAASAINTKLGTGGT